MQQRTPILVLTALLLATAAQAQLVFEDHFDDGSLDSAWTIHTEYVSAWAGEELGTTFRVTDIAHTEPLQWAGVVLERDLPCLGDFDIRADLQWTGSGLQIMQYARLRLYHEEEQLAWGGYRDAWVGQQGALGGGVLDGSSWDTGNGHTPSVGTVAVRLRRVSSWLELWIDDVLRAEGASLPSATLLEIHFAHWERPGSTMGDLRVDRVRVEGAPSKPQLSIARVDSLVQLDWTGCPELPSRLWWAATADAAWPAAWNVAGDYPTGNGTATWPLNEGLRVFRVTQSHD